MADSNYIELRRLAKKVRQYQREFFRFKSKESQARAMQYEEKLDKLLYAMDQLDALKESTAGKQLSLLGDDQAVTQAMRQGTGGVL